MNRRDDVQGLRAVAVLMVVAFHAGLPVPGGFAGVDVFFVISGFVIGRLLLHELETTDRIAFGAFYARRVQRLVPPLVAAVVVTLLAGILFTAGEQAVQLMRSAIAAVVGASNGYFYIVTGDYFAWPADAVPLLHTWTLAVEAQFYLVMPIAMVAAWALARRLGAEPQRVLLAVAAAALAASLIAGQLLAGGFSLGGRIPDPGSLAFYLSPTRAWEFIAGALVALAEARLVARTPSRAIAAVSAGALGAIVLSAVVSPPGAVPGIGVLLPVVATAVLLATLTVDTSSSAGRALTWSAMRWIGDRSYSWYLWHWPFIVFGGLASPDRDLAPLMAVLSIGPAALSYRYIERRQAAARRYPAPRLALGAAVLVGAVGAGFLAGQAAIADRSDLGDVDAATREPALVESDACTAPDGTTWDYSSPGVAHCADAARRDAGRILLIGDSQADAYGFPLLRIARDRGMALDAATGPSCMVSPLRTASGARATAGTSCDTLPERILKSIRDDPPKLLVVTQARSSLLLPMGRDSADSTRRYTDATRTLVDAVTGAGGRVLLLRTVPIGRHEPSLCASGLRVLSGKAGSCLTTDRPFAEIDARDWPIWAGQRAVAAATDGVTTFDPAPLFCRARSCSQIRGGRLAYRNSQHLSVDGAMGLLPALNQAVAEAMRG